MSIEELTSEIKECLDNIPPILPIKIFRKDYERNMFVLTIPKQINPLQAETVLRYLVKHALEEYFDEIWLEIEMRVNNIKIRPDVMLKSEGFNVVFEAKRRWYSFPDGKEYKNPKKIVVYPETVNLLYEVSYLRIDDLKLVEAGYPRIWDDNLRNSFKWSDSALIIIDRIGRYLYDYAKGGVIEVKPAKPLASSLRRISISRRRNFWHDYYAYLVWRHYFKQGYIVACDVQLEGSKKYAYRITRVPFGPEGYTIKRVSKGHFRIDLTVAPAEDFTPIIGIEVKTNNDFKSDKLAQIKDQLMSYLTSGDIEHIYLAVPSSSIDKAEDLLSDLDRIGLLEIAENGNVREIIKADKIPLTSIIEYESVVYPPHDYSL